MAPQKIAFVLCVAVALVAMVMSLGCGLKAHPEPYSKLAPKKVAKLSLRPVKSGMEISFDIPEADRPQRTVVEVLLYYAYRPLGAKLPCGKCPIVLKKHRSLKVAKDKTGRVRGGTFVFLDSQAPFGRVAIYQVALKDATGKRSPLSPWAAAVRLAPPAAPTGLKAKAAADSVALSWRPVTKPGGVIGYIVYRKAEKKVTPITPKPVKTTAFVDHGVITGHTYAYQVAAVRKKGRHTIKGAPSAWVQATPADTEPPAAPKELVTVSAPAGVYLRFVASASQDVVGYFIMRQSKSGGAWVRLNPKPVKENAFVDKTAKPGETYLYRVIAVDQRGNRSTPSTVAEVAHQP